MLGGVTPEPLDYARPPPRRRTPNRPTYWLWLFALALLGILLGVVVCTLAIYRAL
jgi:hypothetical protein